MPDPTPTIETPEAFALRVEQEACDDELRLDERDLIRMLRTRDAAIIAQHTAELTARIRELEQSLEKERRPDGQVMFVSPQFKADVTERARRCTAAEERVGELTRELALRDSDLCILRSRLTNCYGVSSERGAAIGERDEEIARLRDQLTASAQREASVRAEAREAALREAMAAIEGQYRHQVALAVDGKPTALEIARGLIFAVRELLTSPPPPPRVDAWIPVSERLPEYGVSLIARDEFYGTIGEAAYWGEQGWEFAGPRKDDCSVTHWQRLPRFDEPPSAEPANGGSDR